jgi:ketosteroid isomerase-like protein
MVIKRQLKTVLIASALTSIITSCAQPQKEEPIQKEKVEKIDNLKKYKMELNENKAIVNEFIEAMKTSNVDKLKTMITDDFSWWIIGKPEYLATAGEHDTEYFLGFFKGAALFPEGADFKTTSMISEGNKVAAEAEFKANTAMGTYYENSYHFLFIIEDGKVKRMKEYMDTYHAKVTFGL